MEFYQIQIKTHRHPIIRQTVVKVEAKKVKSKTKEEDKKVTFQDQLPGNQQLNKAKKQQFKQMLKKRKRAG